MFFLDSYNKCTLTGPTTHWLDVWHVLHRPNQYFLDKACPERCANRSQEETVRPPTPTQPPSTNWSNQDVFSSKYKKKNATSVPWGGLLRPMFDMHGFMFYLPAVWGGPLAQNQTSFHLICLMVEGYWLKLLSLWKIAGYNYCPKWSLNPFSLSLFHTVRQSSFE